MAAWFKENRNKNYFQCHYVGAMTILTHTTDLGECWVREYAVVCWNHLK